MMRRFRLAVLLAILALVGGLAAYWLDGGRLRRAEERLLAANSGGSLPELPSESFFHREAWRELQGLALLRRADYPAAEAKLREVGARGGAVRSEAFLAFFSDRADYAALRIYLNFLETHGAGAPFYRAMAYSAFLDPVASDALLGALPEAEKKSRKREIALIRDLNRQVRQGRVDFVFDANDRPAAAYDVRRKEVVSLIPGFRADGLAAPVQRGLHWVNLTIDGEVHRQLQRLFTGMGVQGTFLLLDLNDSAIEAAFSTGAGEGAGRDNRALTQEYEPGSIIKVLTLLAWLRKGGKDIFPFECLGKMELDGVSFYDWVRHDRIRDYGEAMAVSCNLAFARMGLEAGAPAMREVLDAFYFNRKGGDWGGVAYSYGRYRVSGGSRLDLAYLSVGLRNVTITTYHAAVLAGAAARGGVLDEPVLVRGRENILGLGYDPHVVRSLTVMRDNAAFMKVKNAMARVAEDERGTGRRAQVQGLRFGVKTGTAGEKDDGLDAVLIGFFPVEKPRRAFAFRLEGAGKAELRGALFLQQFLSGFSKK